jgi:hypothetical protein
MNKFLTTPFGDFLKTFFLTLIGMLIFQIENGMDIFKIDRKFLVEISVSALIASLKVLHTFKNKYDLRYGKTLKQDNYTGKL